MDDERLKGHLALLGVNAALSGLTTGTLQWWRGGSFADGFVRGAAGGMGVYAGKVLVVQDFPGAGLLGRSVAGVGSSITYNAAEGAPSFERLILPLGLLRVHVNPTGPDPVRATVDLPGVLTLGWTIASQRDARFDLEASLSSGAPVFQVPSQPGNRDWIGRHIAGVVLVRSDAGGATGSAELMAKALAHERVHLVQYDQFYALWSKPAERALFSVVPGGKQVGRYLDLSLHGLLIGGIGYYIPYDSQPWEIEAHFLSDTW